MQNEKDIMRLTLESVVESLAKDFMGRGMSPGDLVDAAVSGIGLAWKVKEDDYIKEKLGH